MSVSFIWVRYFQAAFRWTGQHLAVGRILVSDIAFSELSVAVAIGRRIQVSDLVWGWWMFSGCFKAEVRLKPNFNKVKIPEQKFQTTFCPYRISVMPPTAAAQPATSEICKGSPKTHAELSMPKIGTSVIYAAALPAPKVFTPSKYHA